MAGFFTSQCFHQGLSKAVIKNGDIIIIKPQWQDAGNARFNWVARNDEEHGRVDINLGSHKSKAARHAIGAKGAHLIFLPPYSPDLNLIERMFAKLKHLLREARPRDVEATWRKVGELLDFFSPGECENYLRNSGYVSV
jgi:transposase